MASGEKTDIQFIDHDDEIFKRLEKEYLYRLMKVDLKRWGFTLIFFGFFSDPISFIIGILCLLIQKRFCFLLAGLVITSYSAAMFSGLTIVWVLLEKL